MSVQAMALRLAAQLTPTAGGCLVWTGCTDGGMGYGVVSVSNRSVRTHRLAWEVAHRRPVPQGQCVLHRCDNPPCCNPEHLFLGTRADNLADMRAKGREARGERHGSARLGAEQIRAIRSAHREGASRYDLAHQYGVTHQHIHKIVTFKLWRNVS